MCAPWAPVYRRHVRVQPETTPAGTTFSAFWDANWQARPPGIPGPVVGPVECGWAAGKNWVAATSRPERAQGASQLNTKL